MKSKSLWIIIAIVAVVGIWAFSGYNGMVDKQEVATTALSNVEAAYQRRADMMPQLAKIVKAYAKHERETFAEVAKARNNATQIHLDASNLTPEKLKEFEAAQSQVSSALTRLLAVAERYPDLKASKNFESLQIQEEGTENRINEARRAYNTAVQDYNQTIRHFPNSIVAAITGFDKMIKFEAASGAEKAPELDI